MSNHFIRRAIFGKTVYPIEAEITDTMKATTILIVDDDQDDIEIFIEVLQEISTTIKTHFTFNGEDALLLLHEMKNKTLPDYIFLDLNMPKLSGKECLTEIKKDKDLQHIPVIIYSTSSREDDIKETKNLGASFFLTKPEKYTDLSKAISYIIDGYKIQA